MQKVPQGERSAKLVRPVLAREAEDVFVELRPLGHRALLDVVGEVVDAQETLVLHHLRRVEGEEDVAVRGLAVSGLHEVDEAVPDPVDRRAAIDALSFVTTRAPRDGLATCEVGVLHQPAHRR